MDIKELFKELRLLLRDFGVLLSAMPVEAGDFEEMEKEDKIGIGITEFNPPEQPPRPEQGKTS